MHTCVYMYVKMNNSNDTRDRREKLGLFGYYKISTLL